MTPDGRILLVKDWINQRYWSLPGGGIVKDESYEESLKRELQEELGVTVPVSSIRYLTTIKASGAPLILACCLVPVSDTLIPRLNKVEILEARWFSIEQLPLNSDPSIKDISSVLKVGLRS